jgi:hypothetical protein
MKTSHRFQVRGYGWQKDLPDQRDFSYAAPSPPAGAKLYFRRVSKSEHSENQKTN